MSKKEERKFLNLCDKTKNYYSKNILDLKIDLLRYNEQSIYQLLECLLLGLKLGYTESEINNIRRKRLNDSYELKTEYKKTPIPNNQDNKDKYIGGGGSNGNKVRYPSKKRSLKVWKNFYKLFPYYAEKDGWNGKTSTRYGNHNQ